MDQRIGAQLYTLREFCKTAEDFNETLRKVKEIGYQTIQVSGIGPIPADEVKRIADAHGLEIMCTHKKDVDFKEKLDQTIQDHKLMNCNIIGIGCMCAEAQESKEGLMQFISDYNRIAAEIKKSGLQFAYHNHAFEFVKYDGKYVMDYILENTDPDDFKLILDTYWLAVAGQNPAEFIRKNSNRIAAIHYKDLAMKENTAIMAEVMEGNLAWDEIIAASRESDAVCALVEQDICQRDPFESLAISYRNLCTKGFC